MRRSDSNNIIGKFETSRNGEISMEIRNLPVQEVPANFDFASLRIPSCYRLAQGIIVMMHLKTNTKQVQQK